MALVSRKVVCVEVAGSRGVWMEAGASVFDGARTYRDV